MGMGIQLSLVYPTPVAPAPPAPGYSEEEVAASDWKLDAHTREAGRRGVDAARAALAAARGAAA